MDFEEVKRIWEEADLRLSALETEMSELAGAAAQSRRRTAFERLMRRYSLFSVLGGVMVIYSLLMLRSDLYPLPIGLSMAFYFAVVAVVAMWQYLSLQRIGIDTMAVSEVSRRVAVCRRRHLRFMAVMIPLAAVIVAAMMWQWFDDKYMLLALGGGAFLGILIGVRVYTRIMADYRSLRQ